MKVKGTDLDETTEGQLDGFIAGDPGSEGAGITIRGVVYDSELKVSELGGVRQADLILHRHSTTVPVTVIGSRSNSDTSAHAAVTTGQSLIDITGAGWDGTDYEISSRIQFVVDGTVGSNDVPGRIEFSTATAGTITERLRINQNGAFGIGGANFGASGQVIISAGSAAAPAWGQLGTAGISDDSVTYAKMQNVSATDKVLGRSTAGAGDIEEITCTPAGRALLDDADAAAQRTTLGIVADGAGDIWVEKAGDAMTGALTINGNPPSAGQLGVVGAAGGISLALSDNTNNSLYIKHVSGGPATFGTDAGGDLAFAADGFTEIMRIKADGKIGIGTTEPLSKVTLRLDGGAPSASLITSDTLTMLGEAQSPTLSGITASTTQTMILKGTRARGTLTSPTAAASGDFTFLFLGSGYDGTATFATAGIETKIDGAVSTNVVPQRIGFLTGPTTARIERMRIASGGNTYFPGVGTTASAANAFLNSGSSPANELLRSTSSIKYKTAVEDLWSTNADAVLKCRPVYYKSKAAADRKDWSYYGLIAEEVAAIDPRLVHWGYHEDDYDIVEEGEADQKQQKTILKPGADLKPDGVQYERLCVLLIDVVRRLEQRVAALEIEKGL